MRIMLIRANGKHEANKLFREASCFERSLQRIGVMSDCWGPGYQKYSLGFEEVAKNCDVLFVLENYERGGWIPNLASYHMPKVFWSIDSHVVLKRHVEFCNRNAINVLLNSTERYIGNFNVEKKFWFPNCYPDDLFDEHIRIIGTVKKSVDIGFCGNINNRGGWLDMLGIKPDVMVIGENMIRKISGYRIHWNRSIRDDINYRVFETLGIGTFLLTNKLPGLDKLLVNGKHYVGYTNGDDCIEKMRYYLKNESARENIAEAGHKFVKRNHTYDVRARQLVEILKGL